MRFVDQFLLAVHTALLRRSVIGRALPGDVRPYRDATAPRYHRPGGGAWRHVNPAQPPEREIRAERDEQHAKWTADIRKERHQDAEREALLHAVGATPKRKLSARAQRRMIARATDKFIRVSERHLGE